MNKDLDCCGMELAPGLLQISLKYFIKKLSTQKTLYQTRKHLKPDSSKIISETFVLFRNLPENLKIFSYHIFFHHDFSNNFPPCTGRPFLWQFDNNSFSCVLVHWPPPQCFLIRAPSSSGRPVPLGIISTTKLHSKRVVQPATHHGRCKSQHWNPVHKTIKHR